MDGLQWKTLLKWMIWGYHYFWKQPNGKMFSKPSELFVRSHAGILGRYFGPQKVSDSSCFLIVAKNLRFAKCSTSTHKSNFIHRLICNFSMSKWISWYKICGKHHSQLSNLFWILPPLDCWKDFLAQRGPGHKQFIPITFLPPQTGCQIWWPTDRVQLFSRWNDLPLSTRRKRSLFFS